VILFTKFKHKLQSSKHLSTLSIGELRYTLRYMHLLDVKLTNNNDVELMMIYLNTRKVSTDSIIFIIIIYCYRVYLI